MKLKFTKMHGLGNDFMVIEAIHQTFTLDPDTIRAWADRHTGIGFDQLLLVERPHQPQNDFRYRIFNHDGSEVAQCGNGARCFAKFVYDQKLSPLRQLQVETLKGLLTTDYQGDHNITVNMGVPLFHPSEIPFIAEHEALSYTLPLADINLEISVASMGNPHAVHSVSNINTAPVAQWGQAIEQHAQFPERVNAGFMEILTPNQIRLRVYERGAGETQACGSGACAAVVTGIRQGKLASCVNVIMAGGTLTIRWEGSGQPVMMTGSATTVFQGEILFQPKG